MLKARHLRHPVRAARGAEQLLRFHLSALKRARDGTRIHKDDPRWKLDHVEEGFRHRIDSQQCDTELLRRICKAYEAASRAPVPKAYRATEWWEALRRTSLQRVIHALEEQDVDALQSMYANFFRDRCSDGLVGKTPLLKPSFTLPVTRVHQAAYLSEALSQIDTWQNITHSKHDLRDLNGPAIGNPFGIVVDGVLIPAGAVHQHYYAQRIASILGDGPAVVAEIGGGYGAMAYYLLRDRPQTAYINFDLPESLALSAYYLIKGFPEKRFLLYGETSDEDTAIGDFDVVLLPLSHLFAIPARYADLIFSSHVMSDLTPEALTVYLTNVSTVSRKYFLYEGMHQSRSGIQNLILTTCPALALTWEKRFSFSGHNACDPQLELLYERAHPAD